ncbi:MAG: transglutaminase domain-containing protein [Clostridia bacterium]|nr:transglutaminase domain-containing protein [Clostridia bacterium]
MSRLHEYLNSDRFAEFLVSFLTSAGLASICCAGFFPAPNIAGIYLWCALFSLLISLYRSWHFRLKGLAVLVLAVGMGLAGAFLQWGPVHSCIEAVKAFVYMKSGFTDVLTIYADRILPVLCLVFTFICASAAADDSGFSAGILVTGGCILISLMLPKPQLLLYALPAFAGLVLQLTRYRRSAAIAVPLALLLAFIAYAVTPQETSPVQPFDQTAQKIQQLLEDHLMFTGERTSFSLATDGYMPLEVRLGGKPELSQRSVMTVKTDETVLLRGKTYDFYTGISWEDSLSAKRYLYHSLYSRDLRTELFGLERPLTGTAQLPLKQVEVEMIAEGTTTLFAPARTREMQLYSDRAVLYFNTACELFLTRNTLPSERYTLSYLPLHSGHSNTAQLISACAELPDPYYETVRSQYLALPDHIQQEIFDIAADAVYENATPYAKALQLQDFLKSNYEYSLDVDTPPENVDFTAYFLLGEKKGYCTYFATAMTVLCRINDIPARFVTGYLAQPDENGVAHVQGKNAHAWTEIYLKGFGWLPIDATGSGDLPEGEDPQQQPPHSTPSPESTPTPTLPPAQSSTPTPSPTQTPTESPATPPPGQTSPSPSPDPSSAPNQTPAPQSAPEDRDDRGNGASWLWLILLAVIVLVVLRWHLTRPQVRASRKPQDAARIYYRAMERMLRQRKLERAPQETLHGFAQRCFDAGFGGAAQAIAVYAAHLYGNKQLDPLIIREQYLALYQAAKWHRKAIFTLQCMFGRG